jgi:hypothetical protein
MSSLEVPHRPDMGSKYCVLLTGMQLHVVVPLPLPTGPEAGILYFRQCSTSKYYNEGGRVWESELQNGHTTTDDISPDPVLISV